MSYYADRVSDSTTTTGTGTLTLANTSSTGFVTFAVGLGSQPVYVDYCITDASGNFEVGKGLFNGITSLTREVVYQSSNSNNLVSFGAGTKTVFVTAPARQISRANIGRTLAITNGLAMP
jgi:hypothetical protein